MTLIESPKDTTLIAEHIASGTKVANSTNNGTGVDCRQFEFVVFIIHTTAASTFTGMTITVSHSDDDSTWTTDQTANATDDFSDFKAILLRTVGYKRYIRLTVVPTGGNWAGGALSLLSGPGSSIAASGNMSWHAEILTPA